MSEPWTVATARNALNVAGYESAEAAKLLEGVLRGLPPPTDLADRQEGRLPYDVATDILATIECVLADDVLPAIANLQRAARVTHAELKREFLAWKRRWRL